MRTAALVLAVTIAAPAAAAPAHRYALVVGANRGLADDQPLRFAEADAERMARVLRELGGFAREDVQVLRTPDEAQLGRALEATAKQARAEADAGRAPLVLFYFSGHADEQALHVAGGTVSIDRLRAWLGESRAAVRLAVLDACRSGALTRVKGAHAAPAIEVRLSDELTTRGEAMLTSSTADELARESNALGGSFFTHHLVSGLRGAADRSKDGRVTLAEAYDYAYAKTVRAADGSQHPTFKYDLAGRGDVVLTSLGEAGAWLHFPEGEEGQYYLFSDDGDILGDVEVGKTPLKVAVAPGRYEVRRRTPQGDLAVTFQVSAGEERWVHASEMTPVPPRWPGARKGGEPDDEEELPPPQPAPSPQAAPAPQWLPQVPAGERAKTDRAVGWGYVGVGFAGVGVSAGLGGGIASANSASASTVLGPLTALGIVAATAMFTAGGLRLEDARIEAFADRTLAPGPRRDAWELARQQKRRATGIALASSGAGLAVAGLAIGATGAYQANQRNAPQCQVSGCPYDNNWTTEMAIGFMTASLSLGVAIAGLTYYVDARRQLTQNDTLLLQPLVYSLPGGGGGVGVAGRF